MSYPDIIFAEWITIGSDNDMVQNRWRVITCTNGNLLPIWSSWKTKWIVSTDYVVCVFNVWDLPGLKHIIAGKQEGCW